MFLTAFGAEFASAGDIRAAVRAFYRRGIAFCGLSGLRRLTIASKRACHNSAYSEPCAHTDARAHKRAARAGISRRALHRFRRGNFHKRIGLVAEYAEFGTLVESLFDFRRNGHILDKEIYEFETDLAEFCLNLRLDDFVEFHRVGGKIERGNFAFAETVGKRRDEHRLQKAGNVFGFETAVSSEKFFKEYRRVVNPERERAVTPYPYRAEVGIAHHYGIERSPLDIRKLFGVYEIYVAGNRSLKRILPRGEFGKNRKNLRLHIMQARRKNIRYLTFMYENGNL